MRFLFAVLLMFAPLSAKALPLELTWNPVTHDASGNPLPEPPRYKIYRSANGGTFKLMGDRAGNWFTWYVPSYGPYVFRITAYNEYGESDPSDINIFVDVCPRVEQ